MTPSVMLAINRPEPGQVMFRLQPGLTQPGRGQFLLGYVAIDGGLGDDLAADPNGRHRDHDRDRLTILAQRTVSNEGTYRFPRGRSVDPSPERRPPDGAGRETPLWPMASAAVITEQPLGRRAPGLTQPSRSAPTIGSSDASTIAARVVETAWEPGPTAPPTVQWPHAAPVRTLGPSRTRLPFKKAVAGPSTHDLWPPALRRWFPTPR